MDRCVPLSFLSSQNSNPFIVSVNTCFTSYLCRNEISSTSCYKIHHTNTNHYLYNHTQFHFKYTIIVQRTTQSNQHLRASYHKTITSIIINILWDYSLFSKFLILIILLSINYGILSHRYYVSTFAHIWKLLPYCFHFKSSIISLLVSSLDSTFIHDAHTPWCCKLVCIISLEVQAKLLCLHCSLFARF